MSDSEEYGSIGSGDDDLGSDFGEMEAEYEVDDDGNPINANGTVTSSGESKQVSKSKKEETVDAETRKK